MKIDIAPEEGGSIRLTEVYSGVLMETSEGNQIGICMRDDTFEINIIPKGAGEKRNWWRVDMQNGTMVCDAPVEATTDSCNDSTKQQGGAG